VSVQREARDLRLRRPDRCAICRVKLPAGTNATWHPARRVVTCLTCSVNAAVRLGSNKAGASFVDTDGLPLLGGQSVRGVLIDGTRAVAKLARRPGPLGRAEISALYERLGVTLPAA
jgi:hypothetical protein